MKAAFTLPFIINIVKHYFAIVLMKVKEHLGSLFEITFIFLFHFFPPEGPANFRTQLYLFADF